MSDELKDEVSSLYSSLFNQFSEEINQGRTSSSKYEQAAQRLAIKETALQTFLKHPDVDKNLVWTQIYRAHLARKSGVDLPVPPETIEKVISANQSWIKSSGHAFEEMVKDLCSPVLAPSGIQFILQREASELLQAGKLRNEQPDILALRNYMASSVFDLYAIKDNAIFGCIQAKTSVRDRVTRDREPSLGAMHHFFWSIIFVLDGKFLRLPKFQSMVKGGSEEFEQNGWHGLYALSLPAGMSCDRIYKLDANLENIKAHTLKAYDQWANRRQWFTNEWKADSEA